VTLADLPVMLREENARKLDVVAPAVLPAGSPRQKPAESTGRGDIGHPPGRPSRNRRGNARRGWVSKGGGNPPLRPTAGSRA